MVGILSKLEALLSMFLFLLDVVNESLCTSYAKVIANVEQN